MKQILLATVLILVPVAAFTAAELWLVPAPTKAADFLGDMSAYQVIVTDTQRIAATGDLANAKARIADLETLWDDAEGDLRPADPAAWGNVDGVADRAFSALRATHPDPARVDKALTALLATLADPAGTGGGGGPALQVAGIAVTDANGHALPCEAMLADLDRAFSDGAIPADRKANATALQAQALERCNADDDSHADAFTAQALALANR